MRIVITPRCECDTPVPDCDLHTSAERGQRYHLTCRHCSQLWRWDIPRDEADGRLMALAKHVSHGHPVMPVPREELVRIDIEIEG